jgi:hypothetical protein
MGSGILNQFRLMLKIITTIKQNINMKLLCKKFDDGDYYLKKEIILHGLINYANDSHKRIGYSYNDNRKGFWLNKHK